MFKFKSKSIIAMKGHPFTRKTEFANYTAASLGCPVLSLDDFLDFLSPDHRQTPSSSSTCTPPPTQPQDLAFRMMCQIAKSNLSQGFVKEIVIDSPLSSRSHLDQLIELAGSSGQTRLVIVECKTDKIYQWQTMFEEDLDYNPGVTRKWYKAKKWEDVEKAIRDGSDDDKSDGYNKLPKLVIDPLSLYDGDIEARESLLLTPFKDAINYMITREEGDGPDLVVYDRWRQGHYLRSADLNGLEATQNLGPCRAGSGHYITDYAEPCLGLDKCTACDNELLAGAAAYTCNQCSSFALHMECAELLDHLSNKRSIEDGQNLRSLMWQGREKVYPELNFRCDSCDGNNGLDSESPCGDCLFKTHIKTRLLPTVIRHDCHNHILAVEMSQLNPYGQYCICKACGIRIIEFLWYSCKTCGIAYHYSCLTLIDVRAEHEHGRHHHHMSLQYSSEEAEDYVCDVCFERELPERRDPSCWFYSCQDCHYVAHLTCVEDGKTYSDETDEWNSYKFVMTQARKMKEESISIYDLDG